MKKVVNEVIDKKVIKRMDKMDDRQDKMEARLEKLEKKKKNVEKKSTTSEATEDFLRARRSLRLSPCESEPKAIHEFLLKRLKIAEDVISGLRITRTR